MGKNYRINILRMLVRTLKQPKVLSFLSNLKGVNLKAEENYEVKR